MRESQFFEEVMGEGRIEQAREYVHEAIALRFGAEAAAEFRDALRNIADREQLSQLHRLAIKGRRLAELRRGFASAGAAR